MTLSVVVLAGGLATRLFPITEKTPKSLILINNSPFVLNQLKLYQQNEIKHVHFCLGYLGGRVKRVIEESSFSATMKITYSFDGEKLLGTGGALKKALPDLPDTFFVTYGDSFLDIDYKSIESHFLEFKNENYGLMVVYKNLDKLDASNVIFENNKILRYSKKHITGDMKYIDYGISILRKSHFSSFPDHTPFDLSEVFEKLLINGELMGYESLIRFFEIGSLKGIEDLSEYLKTN